ncbi:MAG: hypothetical protein BGP16_12840 [Sphingobium sp. 66-54]|nr:MAG: hypothetical protein BGP16_12840 [Sphingobium sp. 66-54]
MSDKPVKFDHDNPEWTKEDFARAKPLSAYPDLAAAMKKARGAQKAPTKKAVSIRLDADLVDRLRASGRGWQGRVNELLRRALD